MNITPNDIIDQEFDVRLRGYDREEVDSFLEDVAGAFAAVIRERNSLKDENAALNSRINSLMDKQNDVTEAITAVHKMAEDMKAKAAADAEMIVKKARMEAERIVSDAHREALQLEERVMKLRRMQREAIVKIRSTIQGYLDMLDDSSLELPPDDAGLSDEMAGSISHEPETADSVREEGYEKREEETDDAVSLTEEGNTSAVSEDHVNTPESGQQPGQDREKNSIFGFKPEKLIP